LDFLGVDPQEVGGLVDHLEDFWASQAVENIAPITAGGYQPCFAQHHQML
jgi:hypothetical protein